MEIPRVNAVGLLEVPEDYVARPRPLPVVMRLAAASILLAFGLVGTVTTVASLGRYCLTSNATSPSPLQQR